MITRFIFFIFCGIFSLNAFGQIATIEEAKKLAERVFIEKYASVFGHSNIEFQINNSYTYAEESENYYYVCNFKPAGYVIISAEKTVKPVLAFSFKRNCPQNNVSPQFSWWMSGMVSQIKFARTSTTNTVENSEWLRLLSDQYKQPFITKSKGVEPLTITTWNQSPYYNNMCPADGTGPGGNCLSGCVATTLGQLMAYFRYPEQGVGSYTYVDENYGEQSVNFADQHYSWDEMPIALNRENDEIAKLLYHVGVSVDMEYGPQGSGMTNHKGAYTLETYFDYTDSTQYLFRDSVDIDWTGMLISSLDRQIPLYYAGWTDTNFVMGHAFVCDGYTDSTYFHFNWGWGGNYDGYFNIDNLKPGSNDFTLLHEAIINATPKTNYPNYKSGLYELTSLDGLIDDGSGPINNYQGNNSCQWLILPKDSTASIVLEFLKMDILPSDTLYIYNGNDENGELVAALNGDSLPEEIQGTGNTMYIVFNANSDETAEGFLFEYRTTPVEYCFSNIVLDQPIGTISDGSNTFQYNNEMNCTWNIKHHEPILMALSFNYLDTELENDYVRLYDVENKVVIGQFSGDSLPENMEVITSNLLVKFFTNTNIRGDGFELSYELYSANVSEKRGAVINVYPNPAKGNIHVEQSDPEGCHLKVINLAGKVLFDEQFESTIFEIPTHNFDNGIYFIQVKNASGTIVNKVCVQH